MSKINKFLYNPKLEDYIELYNQLPKVNQLKNDSPILSNNKDFLCLSLIDTVNKPALFHVKKYLKYIPKDPKYYGFYFNNPIVWFLPVETISNKIVGFILKSFYGKNYNWVHFSYISLLFGFYDFKDYKYNDPIILTEGWRDCLYIKQYYKYCLALNTSSINSATLELISSLTNKVILIYDNDNTGKKMSVYNQELFQKRKVSVSIINPKLKDIGEYFFNNKYQEEFKNELEYTLKILNNLNLVAS